ncbi:hypothetical protein [Chryseobacterium wanjuense]
MKKYFLSLAVLSLFYTESNACAWSDPDYEYFNLFTQSIIRINPICRFFTAIPQDFIQISSPTEIPDENIDSWKRFFNN